MQFSQPISVVGGGSGSLVDLAGLLEQGADAYYFLPDGAAVNALRSDVIKSDQIGVDEVLNAALAQGRLQSAACLSEAMLASDTTFVRTDGCKENTLEELLLQIAGCLAQTDNYHLVVIRDTVAPGFMDTQIKPLLERVSGRRCGEDFGLCYAPEVVRNEVALADYRNPVRMLVGAEESASADALIALFHSRTGAVVRGSWQEIEVTRKMDQRWHALKMVFAEQMREECDVHGIEFDAVQSAFARDTKLNLSSVQINANSVRIPLGEDGSIHVAAILAPAQSAAENDESYDTKISSLRLASVS